MTTTISSSNAVTSAAPAVANATPVVSRRRRTLIAVLVPGSLLLAGLAWAASSFLRDARDLVGADRFIVRSRSFNVVLKEKGELQAAKSTDVVCEVEGRSTIIYLIPEGTAVKKGDLLIELASDETEKRIRQEELKEANAIMYYDAARTELEIQREKNESDIRKADLKIELRQLALDKYQKGDWGQSLKDANIEIQRATIALERDAEDYEAAQQLRAKDYMTQTEYEQAKFNHTKAQWDLEKAKKALYVLTTYTHKADLRQRQSDLEEAFKERDRIAKNADAEITKKVGSLEGKRKELELTQDELAKLRIQKQKSKIYAPTQGFVVYYSGGGRHFMMGDNQIKEGASVHERQTLLSLPDTTEMIVEIRVHEAKTDKLRLGQAATIRVEGLQGKQFSGTVSKIAVLADSANRWLNPDLKEYETEIKLDATDVPLKPGVTAYVEILVESVEQQLAVPVQSVYAKSGRRYVFSDQRREVVPIEVKLGAIGTEWAEIADGLAGGERILLAFSDEQKRLIPDLPSNRGNRAQRAPAGSSAHKPKAHGGMAHGGKKYKAKPSKSSSAP